MLVIYLLSQLALETPRVCPLDAEIIGRLLYHLAFTWVLEIQTLVPMPTQHHFTQRATSTVSICNFGRCFIDKRQSHLSHSIALKKKRSHIATPAVWPSLGCPISLFPGSAFPKFPKLARLSLGFTQVRGFQTHTFSSYSTRL